MSKPLRLLRALRGESKRFILGQTLKHSDLPLQAGTESASLRINDPYKSWQGSGYDDMTFDQWAKLVRKMPFGCQVWF